MARSREFDTAAAVRAARDLFWAVGYDVASISDLERVTGLSRSSIYQAFGNKRGLFDAAVEDYLEDIVGPRLAPLLDGQADGVRRYIDQMGASLGAMEAGDPRFGCMLVRAGAGLGSRDADAAAVVAGYRRRVEGAIATALGVDARAADIAADVTHRATVVTGLIVSTMLLAPVDLEGALAILAAARVEATPPRAMRASVAA
ncbi:TetR/AcrR family transcriptional regulator [Mycetocola tolaasinivorans]|uniref:TetR/AcrR family transcriptional regulator n=1 Tax=Mycetocola tolaasinivorans TaxID=76635 RepID=A0A3L7ABE2_9MICO|nr:TetR/AcrR family transcriptional regulator [Mycetocola tolaasinivorans]RLP76981.1 TetR/AcrR family transcriptional regulator [Mycetocola tolaasinivorans]